MKKTLIILVLSCLLLGCQNSSKIDINKYDISDTVTNSNTGIELLHVDNDKLYMIENKDNSSSLFTTKSLIITDKTGKQQEIHPIEADRHITDFIQYNDTLYYFHIVISNETYKIELCSLNNEKEQVMKTYNSGDGIEYPQFIKSENHYYYKINQDLYRLDGFKKIATFDNDFFFSQDNSQGLYVRDEKYIYNMKDDKIHKFIKIPDSTLLFLVHNQKVIYTTKTKDNDTASLYEYDINSTKVTEIYAHGNISVQDFTLLQNDILVINTQEDIILYDLNNNKIIETINQKTNNIETVLWIKTDHQDDFFFDGDDFQIIRFQIKNS